jgi:sigma54-dependent transcription regulator
MRVMKRAADGLVGAANGSIKGAIVGSMGAADGLMKRAANGLMMRAIIGLNGNRQWLNVSRWWLSEESR